MTEQGRRSTKHRQESPPSRRVRAEGWYFAVPVIALLLGLVIGGLIVGIAQGGTESAPEAPTPSPVDPSPSEVATVVVPEECLEAADTVRDARLLLRGGVKAVRDLRVQELLDLLGEMEDLDALAGEQVDGCSQADVRQSS